MKRRRAATRLALGASVALLAFAGLGTSHAQDSLAASPSGVYVNETSNGDINVYTNTTSGDGSVEDALTYALDSNGELRVNVSSLWEYFTETGELPVLPPDLISVFGDVVRSLDFEGTADLFRNETFLDSFISQVNSTFPAWVDRFDQLLQSRQSFLDGLGLGTGADSAGSQGNTVALVVGIVLAVVAVLVVGVGAFLFVRERRKRARAVVVLDGPKSTSTFYDDAISLKSATAVMLGDDASGSVVLSQQTNGSVVNKLSNDPVLRWVLEQSGGVDGVDGVDAGKSPRDSTSSSAEGSPKSAAQSASCASVVSMDVPEFLSNLQFRWSELKVARSLGSGACGKVYLARWNETPVAVKVLLDGAGLAVMDGGSGHSPNPRRMLEEIKITAALRHPNVVQFMGFCLSPPSMAAEYCPRGSLYSVLHGVAAGTAPASAPASASAPTLSWLRRVAFAADAAAGMLHLHTRNPLILHRDLNSPNLLVGADWTVKVADMGLSKLLTDSALECGINSVVTSGGGVNPRWLAPEILRGQSCTKASDVFSFGVIMWEILTRRVPWDGETTWSIVGQVQSGGRLRVDDETIDRTPDMDDETLEAFVELMEACWDQDPEKRPEFGGVAASLRELQKRILDKL